MVAQQDSLAIVSVNIDSQQDSIEVPIVTDSMRQVTQGMPVVVEDDTLFYIYTNRGGLTAAVRAKQISKAIADLGKMYGIEPDSVFILTDDYTTDIMYGEKVIISLTDKDAMWEQISRPQLAIRDRASIVEAMKVVVAKQGFWRQVNNFGLVLLILIGVIVIIRLMSWAYHWVETVLQNCKQQFLKPIYIKGYQLLSISLEEKIVFLVLKVLRWILIAILLYIAAGLIFGIFPQTEGIAIKLFDYVWDPLKAIGRKVVNFIPNVFTIAVTCFIFRYIIKLFAYLSNEIAMGKLKIKGFYPDWAQPTFAIIRFILYALMVVMIWEYLPMSNSPIFQGMTVFIGLIMSFASGPALSNLIAGIIITYMRPFQIGDWIKINDTLGNVLEKTPIVTRIRTTKNEIITIPNTNIMTSQSTNLSESARATGLIIHINVTFSYDTPWRTVHELLIGAANKTTDVLQDPAPYVHEVGFDDFYVEYEINAYLGDAGKITAATSDLRENIQEAFNTAGIAMTSQHYQTLTNSGQANPAHTNVDVK
jgi:small-conductance mechanosensitive channel